MGKTKFLDFFSFIGASAIEGWEKSRISGIGFLKVFLVKGKKPQGESTEPHLTPTPLALVTTDTGNGANIKSASHDTNSNWS